MGNGDGNKNPWGSNNNNGGDGPKSPWGSGPGGPSGGGGSGHGPQPDIDEVLRQAQENLRDFMPGGMNSGKFVTMGFILLVLLWLASGFFIVEPGHHGVVQRFGEWDRTRAEEGLGYHAPWPVETVTILNVANVQEMSVGFVELNGRSGQVKRDIPEESLMLTSDRNVVDLDMIVQWNIKSSEDYLFNIWNPEDTLKKVAQSAIREVVGQTEMFPIITRDRENVAQRAREIMIKNLDDYKSGINITQVLIQEAEVHPDVQDAFQDVQSAKQDADDVQNRAEAYREDILPKARGQAIKMKQQAEGYRQSVIARAEGDAQRFNAVYEAYKAGKDVTRRRIYIETMESVLQNAQKIILDENSENGGSGVVPYLPLNELKPSSSKR